MKEKIKEIIKSEIKSFFFIAFVILVVIIGVWEFIDEVMTGTLGKAFGLVAAFFIGYLISQILTENRQLLTMRKRGWEYDIEKNEWKKVG